MTDSAVTEWIKAKGIIQLALTHLCPHHSKQETDQNARALIARLAQEGMLIRDVSPSPVHQKADFSHCFYDDSTWFVYFNHGYVQDLGSDGNEYSIKEFCVHMDPACYDKMREYFMDHPTLDSIP